MSINKKEKFDDLSKNYDLYRPRYKKIFFKEIKNWSNKSKKLNILDIGSGTGIIFEKLINVFGKKNNFYAIDISFKMIRIGKKKFPFVKWIKGKIEEKINYLPKIDIFIFGQSIQWINRKLFFSIVEKKINKNGLICILQNNRNYKINDFLDKYESILESINVNYFRNYRKIKYKEEINLYLKNKNYTYIYMLKPWEIFLTKKQFLGMINSSTQVKEVKLINSKLFFKKLNFLFKCFLYENKVLISYETELFVFKF